ncbi:MAG: hypothetical protein LBU29_01475 [Endomicrobium sp.]|jgi:Flp pilus assembly pilin Flp|nr:hypothetical protein [Endomicrobium sp.]
MLNFNWVKKHRGQGMVEYILIVVVIVGVVFVAYKTFAKKLKDKFIGITEVIEKND